MPRMGREETRVAIDHAKSAFPAWSSRPAKERAKLLRAWADLMLEHVEDLATILTVEQGKPIAESRVEIAMPLHFSSGSARRLSEFTATRFPPT